MVEIIGYVGMILILGAFFLVSSGRLKSNSFGFQGINLIGAILLSVYSVFRAVWPSFVLNGVWSLIALVALIRIVGGRSKAAVAK